MLYFICSRCLGREEVLGYPTFVDGFGGCLIQFSLDELAFGIIVRASVQFFNLTPLLHTVQMFKLGHLRGGNYIG